MAETKTANAQASTKEKAPRKREAVETVYTAEELSNASERFGTRKNVSQQPLNITGKTRRHLKRQKNS